MIDPARFVERAMGGPGRAVDHAALAEFCRTPALAEQLELVAEAVRLLSEIDEAKHRVEAILRREITRFNQLHLGEIAVDRGAAFDA